MDNWGLGKNNGCIEKRPNLFEESKQVLAHINYQRHGDPQEQRLKKGVNLTFKLKNNKIMLFKNKNTICAKQMWKWIFIKLRYANMNMKKT